MILLLEWFK